MTRQQAEQLTAELRTIKWQADPIAYMVERLGVRRETIDWMLLPVYRTHQWRGDVNPLKAICELVAAGTWTAVESAVGVGKTFLGACLVLWFLECWPGSLVVTTAPKGEQLRLHIWREIGRLWPKFGTGELGTLKLKMQPPLDDWIAVGFVAGVSAEEVLSSATKAQGFHAEHMLFILEETPGIAGAVLTALENTAVAPHNLILAFGNPDSQQDTLHTFAKRKNVQTVRISAFDHPNVVMKDPKFVPGAQTVEGLARLLEKYDSNPEAPMYLSRADGMSPAQSTSALIRWEWCEAAAVRQKKTEGAPAIGVDVANSVDGDLAAIAFGVGSVMTEIRAFPCPDPNVLGANVYQEMKLRGVTAEHIGVDAIGVGAGTVGELARLGEQVKKLVSSEQAVDMWRGDVRAQEKFVNLRAQMWWQMRLDLMHGDESGIVLPHDTELFADLCAPTFSEKKGILIEPKEALRKRLGRSPNKGDAAVYWNWVRTGAERTGARYSFGIIGQKEEV
jgi:hypothetical protein